MLRGPKHLRSEEDFPVCSLMLLEVKHSVSVSHAAFDVILFGVFENQCYFI